MIPKTDWQEVYPLPWRVENGYIVSAKGDIPFGTLGALSTEEAICDAMNALHELSHAKGPDYVLEIPDAREQRRFKLYAAALQPMLTAFIPAILTQEGKLQAAIEAALATADAALEAYETQGR